VSTPEQPESEQQGTWIEGRDILPANIPQQSAPIPPPAPPTSAPQRPGSHPRPWSLIIGVPVLIIVCLAIGAAVLSARTGQGGILTGLGARATATPTAGSTIHTAADIGGDPLLGARLETSPPIPRAPVLYLEAQAKGDGQTAWDELSAGAQQQLAQQGGSAAALTQALKQSPLPPLKQITFVGGSTMSDGREATIFVVTADVNGALRQVPYYFTVDTAGKIDEVH
jgi:hypothetical protein